MLMQVSSDRLLSELSGERNKGIISSFATDYDQSFIILQKVKEDVRVEI
jgi:hypothetical protein